MQTIAQTVQKLEKSTSQSHAPIRPHVIDIEQNLLKLLEDLTADLAIPESASDLEACLIIAEYVKTGSMAPR